MGITLGQTPDQLADWEFADIGEGGWHFLYGGVRLRLVLGVVAQIGLPPTFLDRLNVQTAAELLALFGAADEIRDIDFRGRAVCRRFIWRRGVVAAWSLLQDECGLISVFDPAFADVLLE